jgi:integrase
VRRRILDRICERIGTFSYKTMKRAMSSGCATKASTPEDPFDRQGVARSSPGDIARICADYANPAKLVLTRESHNPKVIALGPRLRRSNSRRATRSAQRHDYRLTCSSTGQRISDVARLGPQMGGRQALLYRIQGRNRTPKHHELPILPPLRASIEAYYAAGNPRHLIYLATQTGAQHSIKGLGNWFARQCRMARLGHGLSAHGLRKFAAVRCAEAGATEIELMAIFGWTNPRQAAPYTRRPKRARLEEKAATTLLRETPTAHASENANVGSGKRSSLWGRAPRLDL